MSTLFSNLRGKCFLTFSHHHWGTFSKTKLEYLVLLLAVFWGTSALPVHADLIVKVGNAEVTEGGTGYVDVFFTIPAGTTDTYALAAYQLEMNLSGPTSKLQFTQFDIPENPIFGNQIPKQTLSRPALPGNTTAANDDLPTGENIITNNAGLLRVDFKADIGSAGSYTVTIDGSLARTNFSNGNGELLSTLTTVSFLPGTITVLPVPEPSAFALLGMVALALLGIVWRRRVTVTIATLLILVSINSFAKANTTYNFASYPADQAGQNLSGIIVTDGSTGFLHGDNFLDDGTLVRGNILGVTLSITSSNGSTLLEDAWASAGAIFPDILYSSLYATGNTLTLPPSDTAYFGQGGSDWEIDWSNGIKWSPESPALFEYRSYNLDHSGSSLWQAWTTENPVIGGASSWVIAEVPIWQGPGGGSFNLASNWVNNSVPNGVDATADLLGYITAPSTVTLDSPVTLGTLNFYSAQSYTLAGSSTLKFQASSGNANINVQAGSHQIDVPVIIDSDTVIGGDGTLNLSGGISGDHTLTVVSDLNATRIQVDTLIIGNTGVMAVPEPSTFILLGIAALGLFGHRMDKLAASSLAARSTCGGPPIFSQIEIGRKS